MKVYFYILCLFVLRTAAQVCDYKNSVELVNRTYNGVLYKDGEYFVDNITNVERGCVCMKETCIRKCCRNGQGFDLDEVGCVDVQEAFRPPLPKDSNVSTHILYRGMECYHDDEFPIVEEHQYHIETDNNVYVIEGDNIIHVITLNKYCIDNFVYYDDEIKNKSVKRNGLLACYPVVQADTAEYVVDVTIILISCFFMLLTIAVYAFLPELRTLNGLVMTAHLLSFFVTFVSRATMEIMGLMQTNTRYRCTVITFIIYFSVLAAFSWLNVMFYDLWSKLSISNMAHGFKDSKLVRFTKYCVYALGVPTAMTVFLAVFEFTDLPAKLNIKLVPAIRGDGCFIKGMSNFVYLDMPIIMTLIANVVLFILTIRKLRKTQRETQILQKKSSQQLSLYIKLFLMTGITWILDIVETFHPDIPYIWAIANVYNISIGILIFIVFVCKRNILVGIKNRCVSICA